VPDLFVFTANKRIMIDVSISYPAAASYIAQGADRKPRVALTARARAKSRKYAALAELNAFTFIPFVLESIGDLGTEALDFLRLIADDTEEPQVFLAYAMKRIAIALQRGNALISRQGNSYLRPVARVRPVPASPPRARPLVPMPV